MFTDEAVATELVKCQLREIAGNPKNVFHMTADSSFQTSKTAFILSMAVGKGKHNR